MSWLFFLSLVIFVQVFFLYDLFFLFSSSSSSSSSSHRVFSSFRIHLSSLFFSFLGLLVFFVKGFSSSSRVYLSSTLVFLVFLGCRSFLFSRGFFSLYIIFLMVFLSFSSRVSSGVSTLPTTSRYF